MCPPTGGRSSRDQALAAPMVGSECPGSSGGKWVALVYMGKNCVAQPVDHPDSSDGRALVWFSRGPGFDSKFGSIIFPHIFMMFFPVHFQLHYIL